MQTDIIFRTNLEKDDLPVLRRILISSDYFYDNEIETAMGVAEERLIKGEMKSGYYFLLADKENVPIGFACYGKVPCTKDSYDLYWIAVHDDYRGMGIGKNMLKKIEHHISLLSGRHIWVETSSRTIYYPTRRFYQRSGYRVAAELSNFYGKNDNKIIYVKSI